MGWATVAVVNESWQPLQGATVEAFSLNNPATILGTAVTGKDGVARFTSLAYSAPFFFKPRITRSAGKYADINQNGVMHVQILASSDNCYDAVVDSTNMFGTHQTIQAALNAVKNTQNARVLIFGGVYAENIVPQSGSSTRIVVEACPLHWERLWYPGTVTTANAAVRVVPTTGIPLDLTTAVAVQWIMTGISFEAQDQSSVCVKARSDLVLMAIDCEFKTTVGGTAAVFSIPTSSGFGNGRIQFLRSRVASVGGAAFNFTGIETGPNVWMRESESEGWWDVDGATAGAIRVQDSRLINSGASMSHAIINAGKECYVSNSILSTSGGHAITCTKQIGVALGFNIHDNQFYGDSAHTAVQLRSSNTTGYGHVLGNMFSGWLIGVDIGANIDAVVWGNRYLGVGTSVVGTPTAIDPLESAVTVGLHNILSTTHGDTLAAAVVRGDMMVGNSTPKWARVAIGSSGTVWHSNGTDPSWQALVVGDLPAITYTYYLEAVLASDGVNTMTAKLYDITAAAYVAGSDVTRSSATIARVREVTAITIDLTHEYRVDIGGVAGGTYTLYGAWGVIVPSYGPTVYVSFGEIPIGGFVYTP